MLMLKDQDGPQPEELLTLIPLISKMSSDSINTFPILIEDSLLMLSGDSQQIHFQLTWRNWPVVGWMTQMPLELIRDLELSTTKDGQVLPNKLVDLLLENFWLILLMRRLKVSLKRRLMLLLSIMKLLLNTMIQSIDHLVMRMLSHSQTPSIPKNSRSTNTFLITEQSS